MKWSLRIGRIGGIGIYIHFTFFLFFGWLLFMQMTLGFRTIDVLFYAAFVAAAFTCIVLHELGHAFMAKRFNIGTKDITLLPIGGVARLEKMPQEPKQEFLIAVAGPAVNIVIASCLFSVLLLTENFQPLLQILYQFFSQPKVPHSFIELLESLMAVNLWFVLFNMVPAFPMDGGRVARALLASQMNFVKATHIAATFGQVMAVFFVFLGLTDARFIILIFIGVFVWIGAAQEKQMARVKTAFAGILVGKAMLTEYRTLWPTDTLSRVVELILRGAQHDFPVVEDKRIVGIVTRSHLISSLAKFDQNTPISEIMKTNFPTLNSGDSLESVLPRFQESELPILPVVHNDHLIGVLSMENVAEFLMIESALQNHRLVREKEMKALYAELERAKS
jgi:Zn-dependent protease/CBS domain-containing protein